MPIQTKHLGQPIGWFFSEIGTINQIVHMWGYENFADREKRRAAMAADPAWQTYTAKAAQYLVTQENKILIPAPFSRSEEHTSELQSLMRISYAVFCLKK